MPFISCGKWLACLEGDPMGCGQARMMGSFGVTGGNAEYLLTNEIWCVKLPTSLSFEDGALVEPLAVSLRSARVSGIKAGDRSEEHTSELQSLMRISYAVFCLKKKKKQKNQK